MFIEPTRRYAYSPRFSYDGRYGASLVALLLGGYLLLNSNLGPLAYALSVPSYDPAQIVLFVTQYLFAIGVIVFGLAVAPGATGRRVIAVVVALVLIVVWTLLYMARITGATGPLPFAVGFFTSPAFITALAIATGWLTVRERPGVTYLFLLLTVVAGLIPFLLVLGSTPVLVTQLFAAPVALVIGVGIAWLARTVAGAVQTSHERSPLVDPPPPSA